MERSADIDLPTNSTHSTTNVSDIVLNSPITDRRLYHTSLIKLHFADHSLYRYCFLLFILHTYVHCHCLRFCAFMICYNIIKLISTLDIVAHSFNFYVAFCSP